MLAFFQGWKHQHLQSITCLVLGEAHILLLASCKYPPSFGCHARCCESTSIPDFSIFGKAARAAYWSFRGQWGGNMLCSFPTQITYREDVSKFYPTIWRHKRLENNSKSLCIAAQFFLNALLGNLLPLNARMFLGMGESGSF